MGVSADDCADMLQELASVDGVPLDMNAVARVVLAEEEDARTPVSYSLRFLDVSGHDLLRADFPNPYLDDGGRPTAFNPHRLAAFEDFCRRYAGADGVEVRRLDRAYPSAEG